jgi:hypothetical protein
MLEACFSHPTVLHFPLFCSHQYLATSVERIKEERRGRRRRNRGRKKRKKKKKKRKRKKKKKTCPHQTCCVLLNYLSFVEFSFLFFI